MAIIELKAPYFLPPYPNDALTTPTISTSQVNVNTATTIIAWVLQAPKSGTIEEVSLSRAFVEGQGTLNVRLETLVNGVPSNTLIGTGAFTATPSLADSGGPNWYDMALDTPVAVTVGQKFAIVFQLSIGMDQVYLRHFMDAGLFAFPSVLRSLNNRGSWALLQGYAPLTSLKYSDGTYPSITGMYPYSDVAAVNFSSSTTPDTIGNKFQVPAKVRVKGFWLYADMDGDFNMSIYNSSGTVATYSGSGLEPPYTSGSLMYLLLDSPVELNAGQDYVVAVEATDASTSQYYYAIAPDAARASAFPGDGSFIMTTAKDPTDSTDFTDQSTNMVFMGLVVDGVESGGGGAALPFIGQGGLVY